MRRWRGGLSPPVCSTSGSPSNRSIPKINEIIRPHPRARPRRSAALSCYYRSGGRQKKNIKHQRQNGFDGRQSGVLSGDGEALRENRGGHVHAPVVRAVDAAGSHLGNAPDQGLERFERLTDQIRELKPEGYAVHATEQALKEMVKQWDGARQDLTDAPQEFGNGSLGTRMQHRNGQYVDRYRGGEVLPLSCADRHFLRSRPTLKEMWQGEMTQQVRAERGPPGGFARFPACAGPRSGTKFPPS